MNFGNLLSTGFGAVTNPLLTVGSAAYNAVMNPNIDLIPGFGPNEAGRAQDQVKKNYVKPQPTFVQGARTSSGSQNNTGSWNSSSGGSAASRAPAYDPNVVAQFDQSESLINNSLGRLDNQLGIARQNVLGQYDNNLRNMNTQRDNAETSYKTASTQNSQALRTNKNTITDQASNGLRGLMRMLGAYGAAGSSDASVAGRAVADQASQQRSGAGQNFAENQSGLDTNWGNFGKEFETSKRGLEDWKTNNLNQVESQGLSTRQDLLSKLADIRGQKAATLGGSYRGSAQPYLDQANSLGGRIDDLGRLIQNYTGATPTYQAKELDAYDAGTGTAGLVSNPQEQGAGLNTPYLSLLLGRDKNKNSLLR